MKRETYQRGLPGVKWGIWNCQRKCFQFSISEDTPMLAEARLFQKIGDDARKWRFEPRQLPGQYAKSATFFNLSFPVFTIFSSMRAFSRTYRYKFLLGNSCCVAHNGIFTQLFF